MSLKQKFELEEIANHRAEFIDQTNKAELVRNGILDEIEELEKKKTELNIQIDTLSIRRDELEADTKFNLKKIADLDAQIIEITTEIRDYRGRIVDLLEQIRDLDDTKKRAVEDIEVLDGEIANLEIKIADLEASFKARKDHLDNKISETQLRLQAVLDQLIEAQKKDKQIRRSWAEEHLKLEQRTKVVRNMEARVSDSEARIAELDSYSNL